MSPGERGPERVTSLPVRLGVEIAEVLLSVEHLLELMPGAVLELPLPEGETVTLTLGETPVASARILSDAGKLFLEIVEIFSAEETFSEPGR